MFKKSFTIVIIQIVGALLSFLTLYLVASDMEPEVYSLVGVYNVVSSIMLTFSDLGIETTMMREALYWIENGEGHKVKEYTTEALISRFIGFVFLLPFIIGYLYYMNKTKYHNAYGWLMVFFAIGSMITALNDAMSLVVRSQGGYVFSQAAKTVNNYMFKFCGIILYFLKGANWYLVFCAFSSIPLLFIFLIKLRKNLIFSKIKINKVLKKIYVARYLWLKTDLDFFKTNVDGILVSTLFPSNIMGSYTIFCSLDGMLRLFLDGFFDVLSQNLVKYKGNVEELLRQEKIIKLARNLVMVCLIIGTFTFTLMPEFFINILSMNNYPHISQMITCVGIIGIVHLIGKYEVNILALFAGSKVNFIMGIYTFGISVISYLGLFISKSVYVVLCQKVITYLFTSIISIFVFNKNKINYYNNIYR